MPNDMSQQSEILSASVPVPADAIIIGPATRLLAGVRDLVIDSDAVYEAAASDLAAAKQMKKAVDGDRKELTKPLDELKAKIMDKYRPALELCDQVIAAVEPKMLAYRHQQEEKAEAARQRLEALARAERARLQHEADEARRKAEAEAAAEREAARVKADALAADGRDAEAQRERDDAERRAQETLANAAADEQALRETAAVVVAPAPSTAPPKVAGTSIAGTWKARVTDGRALRKFVGENAMYDNLLTEDASALNAQARSLGKNLTIPGVEVYLDQSIRSRSR